MLLGFVLLGIVSTVVINQDPGSLLSFMLIAGSVVAAFAVERQAVYKIIPLPALFFFGAAVLTGAYHDRAIDTSRTELGLSFLQWIASGFFAVSAATILVLLIAGGRWVMSMQLISGQFPMSAQRSGTGPRPPRTRPAPRPPADRDSRATRDNSAPWGNPAPRDDRARPNDNDPWNHRDDRDPRDDRPRPRY